jgi:hypothetical protein
MPGFYCSTAGAGGGTEAGQGSGEASGKAAHDLLAIFTHASGCKGYGRNFETAAILFRISRTMAIASKSGSSEILFVRPRDNPLVCEIDFILVFGTDLFRYHDNAAPISYGCRPGHGENAVILDRELKLKPLAPIARIDEHSVITGSGRVLVQAPFLPCNAAS